jgi:hypothetical protein
VAADFQHETWLLRRGFVDECVGTEDLADRLTQLLKYIAEGGRLADLQTRRPRRWRPKETVALDHGMPAALEPVGAGRPGILRESSKKRDPVACALHDPADAADFS